jgi:hypothetical protein
MGAGMCSNALANTVSFSGDIVVSNIQVTAGSYIYGDTSIDTFCFSVATDSVVTLDALSFGVGSTWIDPELFLFNDDGNPLGVANLIALNDDWFGADGNGSTSILDSLISVFLTAGNYKFAVGAYNTTTSEVASGVSPYGFGYVVNSIGLNSGAYRVDVTGDGIGVSVVPLPPAAFAGLGLLAGMGAYRRIRK